MPTRTEIQYIVDALSAISKTKNNNIENGYKMRAYMHDQIAKGAEPKGYRPDFIRESVKAVLGTLQGMSEQFNKKYKNDCVSVHDFLDILQSTVHHLKRIEQVSDDESETEESNETA